MNLTRACTMELLNRGSWVFLLFGILIFFSLQVHCDISSNISVTFSKAPLKLSRLSTATFVFEVFEGGNVCRNCSIKCKLDDQISSDCEAMKASYLDLPDGDHIFEVCINEFQGAGCTSYTWTIDTIPPTAYVTAARAFTNALNFSVDISFSEVCSGGGGFGCRSVNACNLLVYGPGQVIPSTLKVLQPDLKFSLLVGLSSNIQYGRVVIVMDKSFCTDVAGNSFQRTTNSRFILHFDRRSVMVNLRTHIPEKLLQLNKETRTVDATNNHKNLKVYLNFSGPVLNSSAEILSSLHISEGLLLPSIGKTNGNRRFGFLVENISSMAIVTITFNSSSIISRQGSSVSPIAPVTFLYDSERPSVKLSTTSNMRTRKQSVLVVIKFAKPVFGFNSSTLSLSGGHLQRQVTTSLFQTYVCVAIENTFHVWTYDNSESRRNCDAKSSIIIRNLRVQSNSEILKHYYSGVLVHSYISPHLDSKLSTNLMEDDWANFHEISWSVYVVNIRADNSAISINVPENITRDVAGNKNLASNILQVRHYTVPIISLVLSTFATAAFTVTSLAAGLLTMSTSSLQSHGVLSRPSYSTSDPARNLFRIACHMQVFALSRWLTVGLPVEYYEFARGLQWSIPYLGLPWEAGNFRSIMVDSSPSAMTGSEMYKRQESQIFRNKQVQDGKLEMDTSISGLPLTPMEYRSFFESHNIKPEADYILDQHISKGWEEFGKNMFWLAVIGGSLMLLHALLYLILRCRRRNVQKHNRYGALVLPRFEIFLIILALPCICQASVALLEGGRPFGIIIAILLLGVTSFLLLALFVFLSVGITFGKLLQYKEVHQEGQKVHWYQDIVRVTLGPGKRGQWTWKDQPNSVHLTMLGPLFEDLRGPPKYMLSQISGGSNSNRAGSIIASDDETEDAEAPFIQKVFGILRIYYTLLESVKRVLLGVVAGVGRENGSSWTLTLVLLCLTSFQLFFIVLKKPFIKKKVQLVEILSIVSEVGIFATCLVLFEKKFSSAGETQIGIFMLSLFLIAFIAQMTNEWYSLYRQTLRLNSTEKSLRSGLKAGLFGLVLILVPWNLLKNLKLSDHFENETASGDQRSSGSRSSGTSDKPWMRQLRELAKASFSKDDTRAQNDPSTSKTRKSGFWSSKRSGSSSVTSSGDFRSKSRSLYRDLDAIFSSHYASVPAAPDPA
ncbi:transmembrane protein [Thalictrum thalictroides]|uniref:Transmembrane protein n=1 Tax=Thalictrum thalictroides TaxID=46969 RepID=A0A7J6URW4_THATH|nr:transmembrane protein [Thalictrum thalictroides]